MENYLINKQKLNNLLNKFKNYFKKDVEMALYSQTERCFGWYIHCFKTKMEKESLQAFVKNYYILRNSIIFSRNDAILALSSTEYKEEKLVAKIRHRNKMKKLQKLCDYVCKFEQEFYDKIGFSLLKIENQRWVDEAQAKINWFSSQMLENTVYC